MKASSGGSKFTSRKYQTFQPGVYLDWERKMIEERLEQAKNPLRTRQGFGGGEGPSRENVPITEADILKYNSTWDPYNPLFNNKEYARKAGYPGIPAFPCFQTPRGNPPSAIPMDVADKWYYANDGSDVKVWTPIFAGDMFTSHPPCPVAKNGTTKAHRLPVRSTISMLQTRHAATQR